jgi:hypothetical protein
MDVYESCAFFSVLTKYGGRVQYIGNYQNLKLNDVTFNQLTDIMTPIDHKNRSDGYRNIK